MKKIISLLLTISFIFLLNSCNSAENKQSISLNSTTNKMGTENNDANNTITPTKEITLTETPTPTPTLSPSEKAKKLNSLAKLYIKNNGSCEIEIDEFTNNIKLTIPKISKDYAIRGDNKEVVSLNAFIVQDTDSDDINPYCLLLYYIYDGSLINPNKIYFKTKEEKLTTSPLNMIEVSTDIGMGYVTQTYLCTFTSDEVDTLYKILKSKNVRVRFSGDNDIDFTLTKKFKKSLLDSIDLYNKFVEEVTN